MKGAEISNITEAKPILNISAFTAPMWHILAYCQQGLNHNEGVVCGGHLGIGNGSWGGCTYRTRTALRPLKAPSVMWLMELWPRRRVWRSPSTARLPSSRRVKLLYDRFLERETERKADRKKGTERKRGKKQGEEREMFCVRSGRRWQVGRMLRQLATSLYLNFMADSMSVCHSVMHFSIVPFSLPQDVNSIWA